MILFRKYSHKLLALILIVSIVPTIIFTSLVYSDKVQNERNNIDTRLKLESKSQADKISNLISEEKIAISHISHQPLVMSKTEDLTNSKLNSDLGFLSKIELMNKFHVDLDFYNWIEDFAILDKKTGKILFTEGFRDLQFSDLQTSNIVETTDSGATDIFLSQDPIVDGSGMFSRDTPTMLIYSPISRETYVPAILVARIDTSNLISNVDGSDSTDEYLVNSEGYFLSKPANIEKLGLLSNPDLKLRVSEPDSGDLTKIFTSRSSDVTVSNLDGYTNYAGDLVVGSISPIENTNWFYVVEMPQKDAFKEVVNLQKNTIVFIVILTAGLAITSILFARNLVKPLEKLRSAVHGVAEGQYLELKVESTDEIGRLSLEFNNMARSLKNSIGKLVYLEKKYKSLFDNSPELIRTIDTRGIILECNEAYARTLGYSKEEIVGKSIFNHISKESYQNLLDSFTVWKKEGNVKNREMWFEKKNGDTFPVLLSATPLYDENGIMIGSNTVIKDMSEIFRTRSELEDHKKKRLYAIGELSARIAHDLRNPLAVISLTVKLLKQKNIITDEKSLEYISKIERSTSRMTHQIDEVLDYVTPKPLQIRESTLSKILNNTTERIIVSPGVKITLPQNDYTIQCDPEKLEIVFANLITNAAQAMNDNGSIIINARDECEKIIVEVRDTGPGIPDDVLPKIFDPLFTTRQIGTGLGLVSCKSIVEKHQGTITVKTILGQGTTFVITLPKINS